MPETLIEPRSTPQHVSIPKGQLYIDGQWCDAQDGQSKANINPATEEPINECAQATAGDADRAIAAARRAFDDGPWSKLEPSDRARYLFRIADLIEQHADELAYRETIDMGMTLSDSRNICVPFIAESFRYYAGHCTKIDGSVRIQRGDRLGFTLREPIGVVGAISPFNFPMVLSVYKIAPALACGNTVVHKPASTTPLSAIKMAEIIEEAGVPEGVFNLITGPGGKVGQALVTSKLVNKISVTGSTETGRQIIKDAADTFKHVTAELGGKSPDIIFADADLESAVEAAFYAGFGNKGEQCFGGTRLLVEESVLDEVVERMTAKLKLAKVGDPLLPDTVVGPVADASEFKKVNEYVRIGLEEDHAKIAFGNYKPQKEGKGFFISPVLFINARNNMRIAQEEIFGPVLTVIPFKSFDDAIRLANDIPYGLASAVHTRDMKKALLAARKLQAGVVWINTYGQFDNNMPFGGVKASGVGRELGPEVLENYLQTKAVWLQTA
jgi:acyl-CoA reductase-like NAD-dependent aldehyde dehydrogenase